MDEHRTTVEGRTDDEAQWVCVCGEGAVSETLAEAQTDARRHEQENA